MKEMIHSFGYYVQNFHIQIKTCLSQLPYREECCSIKNNTISFNDKKVNTFCAHDSNE